MKDNEIYFICEEKDKNKPIQVVCDNNSRIIKGTGNYDYSLIQDLHFYNKEGLMNYIWDMITKGFNLNISVNDGKININVK
jgi:hypothetical protein